MNQTGVLFRRRHIPKILKMARSGLWGRNFEDIEDANAAKSEQGHPETRQPSALSQRWINESIAVSVGASIRRAVSLEPHPSVNSGTTGKTWGLPCSRRTNAASCLHCAYTVKADSPTDSVSY